MKFEDRYRAEKIMNAVLSKLPGLVKKEINREFKEVLKADLEQFNCTRKEALEEWSFEYKELIDLWQTEILCSKFKYPVFETIIKAFKNSVKELKNT